MIRSLNGPTSNPLIIINILLAAGDAGSAGDGESGVVRRQAAAATAGEAAGPTVASHLGMLSYFILS